MDAWQELADRWRYVAGDAVYDVRLAICTDPACAANDARIELVRGGVAVGGFDLDVRTGALLGEAVGEAIVHQAAATVPDAALERWATFQAEERRLASVTLPKRVVEAGNHVMYSSLRGGTPSIFEGGDSAMASVDHGGVTWAFDEGYCPNPACDCQVGSLHVRNVDAPDDDVGFHAGFPLGGLPTIERRYGRLPAAEAEAVLAAFLAGQPKFVDDTRAHYDHVKAIGRRSLAARALKFAKKPSRNAACPCGSGRRYKACCGAA